MEIISFSFLRSGVAKSRNMNSKIRYSEFERCIAGYGDVVERHIEDSDRIVR